MEKRLFFSLEFFASKVNEFRAHIAIFFVVVGFCNNVWSQKEKGDR